METTATVTLSELAKRDRISIKAEKGAPKNPSMPDTHIGWTCTLYFEGQGFENGPTLVTPFYQSELTLKAMQDKNPPSEKRGDNFFVVKRWKERAQRPAPSALDVFTCIVLDASGYENSLNFEDWASEYGYDTDSRTAERTYQIVAEQSKQLRQFLGDRYTEYMNAENDW